MSKDRVQTRTCIACRKEASQDTLIRLCVAQGQVAADILGRLGGRGVYSCPAQSCLTGALRSDRLSRGLKERVVLSDPDLFVAGLRDMLQERILSMLHMAKKAGMLVVGATEVTALSAQGKTAFVITASDLADRSARQVVSPDMERFVFLDKDSLGAALGRESVGVAAVVRGGLARSIARELRRYGALSHLGV